MQKPQIEEYKNTPKIKERALIRRFLLVLGITKSLKSGRTVLI
jgi:hypothetical protein